MTSSGAWPAGVAMVVAAAAAWLWFRRRFGRLLRLAADAPSYLPRWPLVGTPQTIAWNLDKWIEVVDTGHGITCVWIGPYPLFAVFGMENIRKVLNNSNSLSRGNEIETLSEGFIEHGLFSAKVDHWKLTRRHMNPLFQLENVKLMACYFNSNSQDLVLSLKEHLYGGPIDIIGPVMQTALKSVCNIIFGPGMQIDTDSEEFKELLQALDLIPKIIVKRMTQPWLMNNTLARWIFRDEVNAIKKGLTGLTKVARYNLGKNITAKNPNENVNQDLLTVLHVYDNLQKRFGYFTDEYMDEEIGTLYVAATDSIGVTVSWCLVALAQYTHIQDKLFEEVRSADEDGNGHITIDGLKELPFLDQVLKETLRFFTVIPILPRRSTTDIKLGDVTIPADVTFFLLAGALCKDPVSFPDPEAFNPERFAPGLDRASQRYLPFGGGPRNCIGRVFAINIVKIMLIHLIKTYRFTTDMDIHTAKRKLTTTVKSADGYNVQICLRQ